MRGLFADCKHAVRLYVRTPGASLIAVIVLAVAMAFVGAFLSLYVDLVLRPHAGLEQGGRIVTIGQNDGRRLIGVPLALMDRMSDEVTSLEAVAGFVSTSVQVADREQDASQRVELVSRQFFEGIRPRLALGRGFAAEDHRTDAEPVVVVSHEYWQEQLGGDADVLGTAIHVVQRQQGESEPQSTEFRIVGVMSDAFDGVMASGIRFWMPVEMVETLFEGEDFERLRQSSFMQALGRRSAGASAEAVVEEISGRYADAGDDFRLQTGFRLDAIDGVVQNINVHRDARRQLQLFLTGSILLAFVAAANVSLFLLARAPGRRRELGIRMAVGAPLKRLARQLASESGLLVVIAALLGLLISIWLSGFLRGLAFLRQAQWSNVTLLDWRVLILVGAFLLLLTLLVSLAPILGLKRLGIAASSRQVAARPTLAQQLAGTVQIAIAGTIAGAGVAFGWYLGSLMFGYPGYALENRYTVQYSPNTSGITDIQQYFRLMERIIVELDRSREAIEAIPGVNAVSFGRPVPALGSSSTTQLPDPRDPTRQLRVGYGAIDSRYVDVLGLRLLHGRAPSDNEVDVALVNRAFAQELWGRDDVVGESLPARANERTEIVGVLEDLSFEHPSADVEPAIFVSSSSTNSLATLAIIESTLTAAALQQELQRITDAGNVELRVGNVQSLSLLRSNMLAADRARSFLTIGTASLVVLLAAFGFYGTQRYVVTAGRREYAIRTSIGAGPRALRALVFRRGLMMSLPGLVAGGLLAFIVVAWLRDDFVSRDVSPGLVVLWVVAGLTVLLLAASAGPARQAGRTQPAPLLREE